MGADPGRRWTQCRHRRNDQSLGQMGRNAGCRLLRHIRCRASAAVEWTVFRRHHCLKHAQPGHRACCLATIRRSCARAHYQHQYRRIQLASCGRHLRAGWQHALCGWHRTRHGGRRRHGQQQHYAPIHWRLGWRWRRILDVEHR